MAVTVTLSTALQEILPTPNSIGNEHMSDVIGNKNDTLAGNSIIALLKYAANRIEVMNSYLYNASKCYPTLVNGVVVLGGAPAWALGNNVEIIPAGIIPFSFNIFFVNVEAASVTDIYELVLYAGLGAGTEIGRIRTPRNNAFPEAGGAPIACEIIPAGTRISAKVANQTAVAASLTISVFYVPLLV
jgi:hypothetical protein